MISDKGSLLSIFKYHSYFIVIREDIHKSEKFKTEGGIDQLVNLR